MPSADYDEFRQVFHIRLKKESLFNPVGCVLCFGPCDGCDLMAIPKTISEIMEAVSLPTTRFSNKSLITMRYPTPHPAEPSTNELECKRRARPARVIDDESDQEVSGKPNKRKKTSHEERYRKFTLIFDVRDHNLAESFRKCESKLEFCQPPPVTLVKCLEKFRAPELLSTNDSWKCNSCNQQV